MPPKVELLLPAHQIFPECSDPPDPPTGSATLYLSSADGKLWVKKPSGTTVNLESSGGGSWGDITGTLSNQTDLQSALDAKAATGHTHTIANVTSLQTALDGKCAGDDPRLSDARTPLTHNILTAHNGFPGGTSTFLRADGAFASPGGGAGADPPEGSYAPGSYTIATGKFRLASMRQQFTSTQQLAIQGTGRLSLRN